MIQVVSRNSARDERSGANPTGAEPHEIEAQAVGRLGLPGSEPACAECSCRSAYRQSQLLQRPNSASNVHLVNATPSQVKWNAAPLGRYRGQPALRSVSCSSLGNSPTIVELICG